MFVTKSAAFLVILLALHTQGWILNCTFGNVTWTYVGSVYTCTGVFVDTGFRNVTAVNGTHFDGRNDSDVHAIALSNQNLGELPTDLENFFPDLFVLSGSNLNLTQLSHADLAPYRNLRLLVLPNNHLVTLEGDTFSSNPSLEYINFSNNQLRNFGPNLFNNLTELKTIRLLNNFCFNQYIDASNGTGIDSFIWTATFHCPPTFEQLEREILNGQNFGNIIGPILQRIWSLETRLEQLENSTSSRAF